MPTEQYISLFFSLFDTGIPWTIILITTLTATCASGYLYYKRRLHNILPWIAACLFWMLYTTVIRRFQKFVLCILWTRYRLATS